jgi:hypothetical protein
MKVGDTIRFVSFSCVYAWVFLYCYLLLSFTSSRKSVNDRIINLINKDNPDNNDHDRFYLRFLPLPKKYLESCNKSLLCLKGIKKYGLSPYTTLRKINNNCVDVESIPSEYFYNNFYLIDLSNEGDLFCTSFYKIPSTSVLKSGSTLLINREVGNITNINKNKNTDGRFIYFCLFLFPFFLHFTFLSFFIESIFELVEVILYYFRI